MRPSFTQLLTMAAAMSVCSGAQAQQRAERAPLKAAVIFEEGLSPELQGAILSEVGTRAVLGAPHSLTAAALTTPSEPTTPGSSPAPQLAALMSSHDVEVLMIFARGEQVGVYALSMTGPDGEVKGTLTRKLKLNSPTFAQELAAFVREGLAIVEPGVLAHRASAQGTPLAQPEPGTMPAETAPALPARAGESEAIERQPPPRQPGARAELTTSPAPAEIEAADRSPAPPGPVLLRERRISLLFHVHMDSGVMSSSVLRSAGGTERDFTTLSTSVLGGGLHASGLIKRAPSWLWRWGGSAQYGEGSIGLPGELTTTAILSSLRFSLSTDALYALSKNFSLGATTGVMRRSLSSSEPIEFLSGQQNQRYVVLAAKLGPKLRLDLGSRAALELEGALRAARLEWISTGRKTGVDTSLTFTRLVGRTFTLAGGVQLSTLAEGSPAEEGELSSLRHTVFYIGAGATL